MTNLAAPSRSDLAELPAPTVDPIANTTMLPPPGLSVPALAPPDFELTLVNLAPIDPASIDLSSTTEFPAVPAEMSSPANESYGTPSAVDMVMPSLPSLASVAPALSPPPTDGGPTLHQPSQVAMAPITPHAARAVALPDAVTPPSQGGGLRLVARSLVAVVLAGVVGVGAHLGYDRWENRDITAVAGVSVDGTDLASWPQVDPPAIRYTDSTTVFSTDAGTRTLTAHREISSGMTQAAVATTDAAGVASQIELDIRGDLAFIRSSPEETWALTSSADAVALLGDTWTTNVFTVRELFPAEAMPYITVLESVERVLPVEPLQPAADLGEIGAVPIAISTEPTSMVWQYRVIIDIEAFRANETIIFQEWQRRLGRSAVSRLEAWIDNTGIVRQIAVDVDGTKVVHTLVGGSATSSRFDTNPLLESAPGSTPTEPTDAEVTE